MASSTEPSSSLSITSSSHISNGSIGHNTSLLKTVPNLEVASLSRLSSNLEQLLVYPNSDYSDTEVIVEGVHVNVHRCILASRSKFFFDLFKKRDDGSSGKPKYCVNDLLPYGKVGYEAFLILLGYLYTGKVKPFPMEVFTCVDTVCPHDACRPAVDFVVELMYAASVFQVPELVLLFQRRLCNFVEKADVENVLPILVVAFHCQSTQLLMQCVDRVARSDLDKVCIEKELPFEVAEKIRNLRLNSFANDENTCMSTDELHEKKIKQIHRALDSDDVELVKLLLTESGITLNDACALHYAVAYCDPKVVSEVLALALADVNLRNSQGYTVLHVAAMRREPLIIISLLTKGAVASELTLDGLSAVNICRRLTRPKDYHTKTEKGQEANKDRLCIDILEREMRRNPMAGDVSTTSYALPEDLHMKLIYLENRVALARLFFPTEAKVAMDIANVESTYEFGGLYTSKSSSGNLKQVDLNETPAMQLKRLRSRMEALMKTVETGVRYFPHCSEVLDKFMDDDLPDLFYLETGTPDERRIKRKRYRELKDDVQKAFHKDKAEFRRSSLTASSSSSSLKDAVMNM